MGFITLTSDFGDRFAVSQLEAVIHEISPQSKFLVISQDVADYQILEGAFIIEQFSRIVSTPGIHIGVVDPGVGSMRDGLIIKSGDHYFVGPNNGLLYPAALRHGIEKVYKIKESAFGSVSITFHGRDVFAKTAAKIAEGEDITQFAEESSIDKIIHLHFEPNQIVHIDSYGNLKLYHVPFYDSGDILLVRVHNKTLRVPYVHTFVDVPEGDLLAYHGSHDTLELAVREGNAAKQLRVHVGDTLEISKI